VDVWGDGALCDKVVETVSLHLASPPILTVFALFAWAVALLAASLAGSTAASMAARNTKI